MGGGDLSSGKENTSEPLISTDVDRLIVTISEKGKITLTELEKIVRIDKRSMQKWIGVLEEEGYIKIEYRLGATYVIWTGNTEKVEPQMTDEKETATFEVTKQEATTPNEIANLEEKEDEREIIINIEDMDEGKEEFEKHSEYKMQADGSSLNVTTAAGSTTSDQKIEKTQAQETQSEAVEIPPKQSEELKEPALEIPLIDQEETKIQEELETTQNVKEEESTPEQKKLMSPETRELIASYITQINQEKGVISDLKRQRERIFREKFLSLEEKMEADIAAITEMIIDKQTRIADLRTHTLELPSKVSEIEELYGEIKRVKKETKDLLGDIKANAKSTFAEIDQTKEEIEGKVEELDKTLGASQERLEKIQRIENLARSKLESLEQTSTEIEGQLEDLSKTLKSIDQEMNAIKSVRASVADQAGEVEDMIKTQNSSLEALKSEFAGVNKFETSIKNYIENFEKKVSQIDSYVAKSEDELANLREAAETHYLKKYVGALEQMTDSYQGELEEVVQKEKEIEQRIGESKQKVMGLIKDSQEMIKKLRDTEGKPTLEFSSARERVAARVQKIKSGIESETIDAQESSEDSNSPASAVSSSSASTRIGRFELKGPLSKGKKENPKKGSKK
ncbi:hypothetical protein HY990_05410 [Candidatus Micrarchaeota archaeon]|nr:hypothetical protein [Candidatus Micrarchaeota archaeon]